MKLKVTLMRFNGSSDDVLIEADAATTIGEVAETLIRVDKNPLHPSPQPTLAASLPGEHQFTHLSPQALLGEAWIGSGADIRVVDRRIIPPSMRTSAPARAIVKVHGTDRNSTTPSDDTPLPEGSYMLGRSLESKIILADPSVSKRHMRIEVTPTTIEVIDAGSVNGILVNGIHVHRQRIDRPTLMLIGDTWVSVEPAPVLEEITQQPGAVPFTRSPRVEERYAGESFEAPDAPEESEPQPFPFMALLAPILMGAGMYALTQRIYSLLFVVLSPVMMIGNYLTRKSQVEKQR